MIASSMLWKLYAMNEEYLRIRVGKDSAYVRKCCLNRLKEADAAIFDCDGVLIDTRDSYRKCIVETVKYFIRELTGIMLPPDELLRETTHLLKKSGGFNNDWDAAYAILLFLFSKMPDEFRDEFISLTRSKELQQKKMLRERFDYVRNSLESKPQSFTIGLDEIASELKLFAIQADDSGINSIEKEFTNSKEMFLATKRFLNYPGKVRESLLATVFDEMFYGPNLFEEIHGRKRQFYDGPGYVEIEKERILVTCETLEELAKAIEKENFGIVSGRDRLSAKFSLGCVLDKFRREAAIFLMDNNYSDEKKEEKGKLRKPNPYPLIKASKGLEPFKYSLYVGDSAEDMIMVKRANAIDPRFISVGVYSLSDFKEELISYFFKMNIDVILYSIKELPPLLREIKVKNHENC